MVKLVEREADEMERLTLATATGFSISWSKDNWNAWDRARAARNGVTPEDQVANFHRTVSFLATHFPGSVRTVKAN